MTNNVTHKELRRKIIAVPLEKEMTKREDGLVVRGLFTSDSRDQVGDLITRSATERALPAYKQWGNIRRMHAPDPVARVIRIGAEDGLEWNEVEILVIDPKAIFEVENGLLQALSVGILVDYEDIDFLEDGGWIINNYTLAEISLVDHPANYDARLFLSLGLDVDAVRTLGFYGACKEVGLTTKEFRMKTDDTKKTEKEIVSEAAPEEEAVTAEEATQEVEEASASEEEVASDEEAEHNEDAPAAEEAPADEPSNDDQDGDAVKALSAKVDQLTEDMGELTKSVTALTSLIAEQQKAISESGEEVAEEVSDEAPEADGDADIVKRIEAIEERLKTLPERRTSEIDTEGVIPEADADKDLSDDGNERQTVERPKSLREAVKLHLTSK